MNWSERIEQYLREGRTVSGGCGGGPTKDQKQALQAQQALTQQLTQQAQSIYGDSSGVFSDILNAVSPIVAAGPNQQGYSLPELAALKSGAIENEGEAFQHAKQVIGERQAAAGGGNAILPSGVNAGENESLAMGGAEETAKALNQINISNYETGRQNFFNAEQELAGAPNVFNPATSAASTASGAAADASKTALSMPKKTGWASAVGGILGGIGGSLIGAPQLGAQLGSTVGGAIQGS